MKYAIISDIHSNPAALERVLADAARYGVDQVVCAGDIVGYGPYPSRTVEMLRDWNIPAVMGNHDAAVVGWRDTGNMIGSARDATARHRSELSPDDLNWLKELPYVYEDENLAVAHANFYDPRGMRYTYDRHDASRSFYLRGERMLFVGHTHVPAIFAFGFVDNTRFPSCGQKEPQDFRMVDGWNYMVNVGSVGYPRVKGCSTYVLFDSKTGDVLFREVEFDFAGYATALREKSMPIPPWIKANLPKNNFVGGHRF